jgi:hypothetical protein
VLLFLARCTEYVAEQYFFSLLYSSIIGSKVGWFGPVVMVVARVDVTAAWFYSSISVLKSTQLYCILCQMKIVVITLMDPK